jgi:RimJ/RimL family protein N-acetyltransferase
MEAIETARLVLEPLQVAHAREMFEILADPAIYRYLDQPPSPSLEDLRRVYARWEARRSPDGTELWLNWVIRPRDGPFPLGYVQATVISPRTAWVAYVLASKHWGHGYAAEAVAAMLAELASTFGVKRHLASVEAENGRSIRLLERLGFHQSTNEQRDHHSLSPTELLFIRDEAEVTAAAADGAFPANAARAAVDAHARAAHSAPSADG